MNHRITTCGLVASIRIGAGSVLAEDMGFVEAEAAEILGPEVGVVIDPADVDCPDESTVLDDDVMQCEITDAETGERYELIVTFGDFVLREGYEDRFYQVGDQPLPN